MLFPFLALLGSILVVGVFVNRWVQNAAFAVVSATVIVVALGLILQVRDFFVSLIP